MNIKCVLGHKYKRIPTFNLIHFDFDITKNNSYICKCEKCGKMKVFYETDYKNGK